MARRPFDANLIDRRAIAWPSAAPQTSAPGMKPEPALMD
jgi:hypothetical protein